MSTPIVTILLLLVVIADTGVDVVFRFLSSFLCPSAEPSHHRHHRQHHPRSFSEAGEDWPEVMRRSSCDEDVPLNLSLSSSVLHRSDSRSQHHTDSDLRQVDSDPLCTSSSSSPRVDGTAWRRSHRHDDEARHHQSDESDGVIPQQQSALRRHESSPCLHPELRKSSSAGSSTSSSSSK